MRSTSIGRGINDAPHKPLYLLLLLAFAQRKGKRLTEFREIEPTLAEALHRFGLSNKTQNSHYPFWRLQNNDLAELSPITGYEIRRSSNDPNKSSLIKLNAKGGFLPEFHKLLIGNLKTQSRAIHNILDDHFPASIHEDLLLFFNLRVENARSGDIHTDSEFRKIILSAYGKKCALTGYSLQFRGEFPDLEAAHICWPQAGGNDDVSNGILMSTLCRKLFHLGILGIEPSSLTIVISEQASDLGVPSVQISKFLNKKLSLPKEVECQPSIENLAWHKRWVFKS